MPVTLLSDNSEAGQKWDAGSSGWGIVTDKAYSPTHAAHAPEFGSPMLIYGPFNLSAATAATLTFELWYDAPTITFPPSATTCGAFLIGYSTDGSEFTFPTQWSGSTDQAWQRMQVDLGSWYEQVSQSTTSLLGDARVWLALSSSVTSTFASTTEGSYVDDLSLSATIPDTTGPVCAARNATVRRGKTCRLYFKVHDALSQKVTRVLTITTRSGALKKRWSWGYGANSASWRSVSYTCKLARGSYRIRVSGKDLAGNAQSVLGKAWLYVK